MVYSLYPSFMHRFLLDSDFISFFPLLLYLNYCIYNLVLYLCNTSHAYYIPSFWCAL